MDLHSPHLPRICPAIPPQALELNADHHCLARSPSVIQFTSTVYQVRVLPRENTYVVRVYVGFEPRMEPFSFGVAGLYTLAQGWRSMASSSFINEPYPALCT